jgi:uncharacterized protein YjdB
MGKKKLKSKAKINRSLTMTIILFIIVAAIALYIVLNKGVVFGQTLMDLSLKSIAETKELTHTIEAETEKEYLSAKSKETDQITVRIDGVEETEDIEYLSSDENVATVDSNGEIQAVASGIATITARRGELAATVDVHVIVPIKTMTLTCTSKSIKVGNDLQLKLQTTPSDSSIDTISFTSSDESIATVNANGIVTGVSKGEVTITAYDSYTDTEKSVTVTIK